MSYAPEAGTIASSDANLIGTDPSAGSGQKYGGTCPRRAAVGAGREPTLQGSGSLSR